MDKHTLNALKELNHFMSFLCELYSLVILKDKSVQTSRKISYKTSGTSLLEKHVCLYSVLSSLTSDSTA